MPFVRGLRDSYGNGLAESGIDLFKIGVFRQQGCWKGVDDAEFATLDRFAGFNDKRVLGPNGHILPAEFEQLYDRQQQSGLGEAGLN